MRGGNEDFELIQELIGAEVARKLAEAFGGSSVYIPKNAAIAEHYRRIRQEFYNGATYRELAVRYGYTKSHIRRIIHRKK
jgi:Mor family transcriptional regulator